MSAYSMLALFLFSRDVKTLIKPSHAMLCRSRKSCKEREREIGSLIRYRGDIRFSLHKHVRLTRVISEFYVKLPLQLVSRTRWKGHNNLITSFNFIVRNNNYRIKWFCFVKKSKFYNYFLNKINTSYLISNLALWILHSDNENQSTDKY